MAVVTAPSLLLATFSGSLSVGASPFILPIPFNYQMFGVTATVGTPSTSGSVVFDVLRSAAGATTAGATLWPTNPGNRPTVLAGAYAQAPNAVPPSYLPGSVVEFPYAALPDINANPSQQFGTSGPLNNLNDPVQVNEVESAQANWPQVVQTEVYGYYGLAGDTLSVEVVSAGTGTQNGLVMVWVSVG